MKYAESVQTECNYVNQGFKSHIVACKLIRVFTAELRDCNPEFRLQAAGRSWNGSQIIIGIPIDNAWNESSHSEILKFMHAEYWFLIYKSCPKSRSAHHAHRAICIFNVFCILDSVFCVFLLAQVSVAAAMADWPKRIRDMRYADHEDRGMAD